MPYTEEELAQVDAWKQEAKKQTLETLPGFLNNLAEYPHDYNSICIALAMGAVAAATALDHSPRGGITGFQSVAVMWEFMRHWEGVEFPARLVRYENMLFPQYERHYQKTINQETWDWLQDTAKKYLEDRGTLASERVVAHWKSVAAGKVPFGYTVEG